MPTVAQIVAQVTADVTDFDTKIARVSSSLSSLANIFGINGLFMSAALTRPLVAVGSLALSFDDLSFRANTAFTSMMGSAKRASDFMQQLQFFSVTTPFALPDLIQSAQKLMGMGMAAKNVLPTLKAVGDQLAQLGQLGPDKISRITYALGEMLTYGKVNQYTLRQLSSIGISGMKYLAEAAGVSQKQMQEWVHKGIVSGTWAVQALTYEMEKHAPNAMSKMAKSIQTGSTDIQDAIKIATGSLSDSFYKNFTSGLQKASEYIFGFAQMMKGWSTSVKDSIVNAFISLASVGPIYLGLAGVLKLFSLLLSPLGAMTAALAIGVYYLLQHKEAAQALGNWIEQHLVPIIQTAKVALLAFGAVMLWNAVSPVIRLVASLTIGLIKAFASTAFSAIQVGRVLFTFGSQLAANAAVTTSIAVPSLLNLAKAFVVTLATAIRVAAIALFEFSRTIAEFVVNAILGVGTAIFEAAASAVPALLEVGDAAVTSAVPALIEFADTATTVAVPALITFTKTVVTSTVPAIIETAETLVTTAVPALVTTARTIVATAVPALVAFTETLVAEIVPALLLAARTLMWDVVIAVLLFAETLVAVGIPALLSFTAEVGIGLVMAFGAAVASILAFLPEILVIGAAIALVYGAVLLFRKAWVDDWFHIQEAVDSAVLWMSKELESFGNWLENLPFVKIIKGWGTDIQNTFATISETVTEGVNVGKAAFQAGKDSLMSFWNMGTDLDFNKLMKQAQDAFNKAQKSMKVGAPGAPGPIQFNTNDKAAGAKRLQTAFNDMATSMIQDIVRMKAPMESWGKNLEQGSKQLEVEVDLHSGKLKGLSAAHAAFLLALAREYDQLQKYTSLQKQYQTSLQGLIRDVHLGAEATEIQKLQYDFAHQSLDGLTQAQRAHLRSVQEQIVQYTRLKEVLDVISQAKSKTDTSSMTPDLQGAIGQIGGASAFRSLQDLPDKKSEEPGPDQIKNGDRLIAQSGQLGQTLIAQAAAWSEAHEQAFTYASRVGIALGVIKEVEAAQDAYSKSTIELTGEMNRLGQATLQQAIDSVQGFDNWKLLTPQQQQVRLALVETKVALDSLNTTKLDLQSKLTSPSQGADTALQSVNRELSRLRATATPGFDWKAFNTGAQQALDLATQVDRRTAAIGLQNSLGDVTDQLDELRTKLSGTFKPGEAEFTKWMNSPEVRRYLQMLTPQQATQFTSYAKTQFTDLDSLKASDAALESYNKNLEDVQKQSLQLKDAGDPFKLWIDSLMTLNRVTGQLQLPAWLKDPQNLAKAQQVFDLKQKLDAIKQFADSLQSILVNAFNNALQHGIKGFFQSVIQGFNQMILEIAEKMLASQLTKMFIGMMLGSDAASSAVPGHAEGTDWAAWNKPMIVGEKGPELWVPHSQGGIVPNHQLGGGATIHMTVVTPDAASFQRSRSAISGDYTRALQKHAGRR